MKTQELKELAVGRQITSIRTSQTFKILELDEASKKAVVKDADGEEKGVAYATIRRNYDLVKAEKLDKKQDEVEPVIVENVERPNTPKVPKPKATETKQSVISTSAIHDNVKLLQSAIVKEYSNAKQIVTQSYVAFKDVRNFVEIHEGTRALYIMMRTKRMSDEMKDKLDKIYPESNGWAVDGKFVIRDEKDIAEALNLIKMSYVDAKGLSDGNSTKESDEAEEASNA